MNISDSQVFWALFIALIPGILAYRLSTELYK
ncbi:MAG: photosystem I reaction center subunit XII [Leptolyngbyaceae cyanobacterium RU_5_1]|nr:photosystem I reaction center subunit XII [Leptolyngbyaceae cyanobacterium RU_5_1]